MIPLIVCSACLFFATIQQASGQSSYDSLVDKAKTLSYDVQLNEAERLFTEASRISPERAEAYFNIAQIRLWIFLGTDNHSDYTDFMKWFRLTVDKGERLIELNPNNYKAAYLLGNTYTMQAIAETTLHSYLAAFSAVRSASNYYDMALELTPNFYDAYRGAGEIHYFLDFLPGTVKWALPLVGLSANRSAGLSEVRLAYEKGTTDKIRSTLSLAEIYSNYLAEYDSAEALMRELVKKFPRNPMFNYHLAVILIKERNLHEAEKYLDAVIDLNDPRFMVLNNLSVFLKGDIYFKLNDFQNAIKYNELFLSRTNQTDYTGIANYRLAMCYRILGNNDMSKKCLLNAENGNNDIYDDSFSKERSREFLRYGISSDEIMVCEMNNDLEAGKYEELYSSLQPALKHIQNEDTRAEALLVLSEAATRLGKFTEGIRYSREADSVDADYENWLKPRSWFLIALCSYSCGDMATAKRFLDKAEGTDEYARNNLLNAELNNLERKLYGK